MRDRRGAQHDAGGVSGHGSHKAACAGGPQWAESLGIDRVLGAAQRRQAWERLVASCRREAKRAVG